MKLYIKQLLILSALIALSSQVQAKNQRANQDREHSRPEFSSIDTNEDGDIDFDEFSSHDIPHGDHQTVFESFDTDNNGIISTEEFENHKPPQRQRNKEER